MPRSPLRGAQRTNPGLENKCVLPGVVIAAAGNDLAELLGVDASLLGAADVDGNIIIA